MENYLLKNEEVFPEPVFEATIWDNTFEKDLGGFPEAELLMFSKNAKSIISIGNSTLCAFLIRILRIFLKKDVLACLSNVPGSSIISMKLLPAQPSEPWPDHDRVKVKKALRGIKVISFQQLMETFVGKDTILSIFQWHVRQ
ncbi:hypothetical protein SESBI_05857 [Sesbania bispinosa]|nr:hypothetical protein SESBI_05857 [Sesbania bispinosa]